MRIFTYVILVLLIVMGVSFSLLNSEVVSFNYYLGTIKVPLSILLVSTLLLGCFLSLLVSIAFYIRLKSENRRLRHRLKLAEKS